MTRLATSSSAARGNRGRTFPHPDAARAFGAVAFAACSIAQGVAQDPASAMAAKFTPAGSCLQVTVDGRSVRESGLLTAIDAALPRDSVAGLVRMLGCPLADIERLQAFGGAPVAGKRGAIDWRSVVVVLDGPESLANDGREMETVRIGGVDAQVAASDSGPLLRFSPSARRFVTGPRRLLEPLLDGTATGGLDPALASSPKPGFLLQFALRTPEPTDGQAADQAPRPQYVFGTLRRVARDGGGGFALECSMRMGSDDRAGPLAERLRSGLREVAAVPALAKLRELMGRVEVRAGGREVTARVEFADANEMVRAAMQFDAIPPQIVQDAKTRKVQTDLRTILDVAKFQRLKTGAWPKSIDDLTTPDAKGRVALPNLADDPWDHDYELRPTDHGIRISSRGPDGVAGTADDIAVDS